MRELSEATCNRRLYSLSCRPCMILSRWWISALYFSIMLLRWSICVHKHTSIRLIGIECSKAPLALAWELTARFSGQSGSPLHNDDASLFSRWPHLLHELKTFSVRGIANKRHSRISDCSSSIISLGFRRTLTGSRRF